MEKNVRAVAGIDISKKTFDIAVGLNIPGASITKACFANNLEGYTQLEVWLKDQGLTFKEVLFCLENTGLYHRLLATFLLHQKALVWVETPVQIKWSMGIQRGKSDAVDAERIYLYALRNQDKVKAYEQRDEVVQQIADYMALRERLQQCIKTLSLPVKELKSVGLTQAAKASEQASKKSIATMKEELDKLDKEIQALIESDPNLAEKYKYATSVRCVGFVAAAYLIVYTNGFSRFDSAKQLASYAGVAPFEYSSGTSIRGKTKVHPMANKTLKTVLHLCAVSSVRHNPEMVAYFQRKVSEGKNKMLVLNAIRNKVLNRVFACVRDRKEYQMNLAA